jgi:rhodanese-related sulfurtransferase
VLEGKRDGSDVERGPWRPAVPAAPPACSISPSGLATLIAADGAVVLDMASSVEYARAHLPGAWLTSRTYLDRAIQAVPRSARYVVTSPDGLLASFAAPEVAALTGADTFVLAGGTRAWREDARPCERGLSRTSGAVDDVYKRPYEGTGHEASAMQAYLDWEAGLVEQLKRDGTHGFHVIAMA